MFDLTQCVITELESRLDRMRLLLQHNLSSTSTDQEALVKEAERAVARMLTQIEDIKAVDRYIRQLKNKELVLVHKDDLQHLGQLS